MSDDVRRRLLQEKALREKIGVPVAGLNIPDIKTERSSLDKLIQETNVLLQKGKQAQSVPFKQLETKNEQSQEEQPNENFFSFLGVNKDESKEEQERLINTGKVNSIKENLIASGKDRNAIDEYFENLTEENIVKGFDQFVEIRNSQQNTDSQVNNNMTLKGNVTNNIESVHEDTGTGNNGGAMSDEEFARLTRPDYN